MVNGASLGPPRTLILIRAFERGFINARFAASDLSEHTELNFNSTFAISFWTVTSGFDALIIHAEYLLSDHWILPIIIGKIFPESNKVLLLFSGTLSIMEIFWNVGEVIFWLVVIVWLIRHWNE